MHAATVATTLLLIPGQTRWSLAIVPARWHFTHLKHQAASLTQLGMREPALIQLPAIERHSLRVYVRLAQTRSSNGQRLGLWRSGEEMQLERRETRDAQQVDRLRGYRVLFVFSLAFDRYVYIVVNVVSPHHAN